MFGFGQLIEKLKKDPKKIEAVLAWRNRKEGKGNE